MVPGIAGRHIGRSLVGVECILGVPLVQFRDKDLHKARSRVLTKVLNGSIDYNTTMHSTRKEYDTLDWF
jgi:hypothetical protein